MHETTVGIPRHGASPREVARASEIWRLFQEVAMRATTAAGWPPDRYRAEGTSFVIYGMTARHHREVAYGQDLRARTWVYDFKRGTLTKRQIRLYDPDLPEEQGLVASCTQQWVHTNAQLQPVRGGEALLASFPPERPEVPPILLPDWERCEPGPAHRYGFTTWHTWMDPLDHVNHPHYVDFCDEGTSRVLAAAGVHPELLMPVAEQVSYKAGAQGGDPVEVVTRLVGRTGEGDAVIEHVVTTGERRVAKGLTVRRLVEGGLVEILAG